MRAGQLAAEPLSSLMETKRLLQRSSASAVLQQMREEGDASFECCRSLPRGRPSRPSSRSESRISENA
jgi:hypothetical protein